MLLLVAVYKAYFPLGEFVRANRQKFGTAPTCSRRIFSPANFNQSRCQIRVFALRRANNVAKWKMGLSYDPKWVHTPDVIECNKSNLELLIDGLP